MMLLDISAWWNSMPGFQQIFWAIAIFFSLMFVIQTVMSFVSGDGDEAFGDADAAISHDGGIDYGFFTIKNFIAFFTIFGWTGVALAKGNVNKGLTIAIALGAGVLVVLMMVFLFRSMSKLKESGTMEIDNAIGKLGETYLFIPSHRNGFGKIHVKIQGSLRELQAVTDDESDIPTGKLVKVVAVVNSNVLVVTSKIS